MIVVGRLEGCFWEAVEALGWLVGWSAAARPRSPANNVSQVSSGVSTFRQ